VKRSVNNLSQKHDQMHLRSHPTVCVQFIIFLSVGVMRWVDLRQGLRGRLWTWKDDTRLL